MAQATVRIIRISAMIMSLSSCDMGLVSKQSGKAIISSLMKDPDSAQFRDVREAKHEGRRIVCGEVNAKNGYGAYAGFERFVVDVTRKNFQFDPGNTVTRERYQKAKNRCVGTRISYWFNERSDYPDVPPPDWQRECTIARSLTRQFYMQNEFYRMWRVCAR